MGRITDNRADIYQEITDQMIAMIEDKAELAKRRQNRAGAPKLRLVQDDDE